MYRVGQGSPVYTTRLQTARNTNILAILVILVIPGLSCGRGGGGSRETVADHRHLDDALRATVPVSSCFPTR